MLTENRSPTLPEVLSDQFAPITGDRKLEAQPLTTLSWAWSAALHRWFLNRSDLASVRKLIWNGSWSSPGTP